MKIICFILIIIIVFIRYVLLKNHNNNNKDIVINNTNTTFDYKKELINNKDKDDYLIFDLSLPLNNSIITVDTILLTSKGIFVIYYQNYNGKIKGNIDNDYWLETITKDNINVIINKIENPVHINKIKIDRLKSLLLVNKLNIFNIVVINNYKESIHIENKDIIPYTYIIYPNDLINKIKQLKSELKNKISEKELKTLKEELEKYHINI